MKLNFEMNMIVRVFSITILSANAFAQGHGGGNKVHGPSALDQQQVQQQQQQQQQIQQQQQQQQQQASASCPLGQSLMQVLSITSTRNHEVIASDISISCQPNPAGPCEDGKIWGLYENSIKNSKDGSFLGKKEGFYCYLTPAGSTAQKQMAGRQAQPLQPQQEQQNSYGLRKQQSQDQADEIKEGRLEAAQIDQEQQTERNEEREEERSMPKYFRARN